MNEWHVAKLEEVAEISGGGTPSRREPSYFGGDIAWATPMDVTSLDELYIRATRERVTQEGLRSSSSKLLPPRSVLLTSRATIGFTAVTEVPICTNQGFINFICGPHLVPEFLAYWLKTQKQKMLQHAGGTTFKEIARGTLRKFEISFPGVAEQRHIVDVLSRAEGIVRLRREAQRKAAQLIPAIFLDMFGDTATNPKRWPVVTLGGVLAACEYGTSKKSSADGAGVPVLRMGNVTYEGNLDLADLKHVELDSSEWNRRRLASGDLLFNRTNSRELVGKTGLWDGRMEAVAASYFIRCRADQTRVMPVYIWAVMNSGYMKRRLFETARGAIGQANINSRELKALTMPLPPLDLQRAFAAKAAAAQGIAKLQAVSATAARATFDALLHCAFSRGRALP